MPLSALPLLYVRSPLQTDHTPCCPSTRCAPSRLGSTSPTWRPSGSTASAAEACKLTATGRSGCNGARKRSRRWRPTRDPPLGILGMACLGRIESERVGGRSSGARCGGYRKERERPYREGGMALGISGSEVFGAEQLKRRREPSGSDDRDGTRSCLEYRAPMSLGRSDSERGGAWGGSGGARCGQDRLQDGRSGSELLVADWLGSEVALRRSANQFIRVSWTPPRGLGERNVFMVQMRFPNLRTVRTFWKVLMVQQGSGFVEYLEALFCGRKLAA
ncbi:hypothetical protein K438DRAFT_1932746 [Mycena galopus ATCC 62051]|nr:hypothetical protein K438DRAFT_1932746 [Mycena galopus ATCC 62051]